MKKPRKRTQSAPGEVIAQVRKPMAPPLRVELDLKKYRRARERKLARDAESS